MIAIKIEPDRNPYLVGIEGGSIADELYQMQDHVGGYIETVRLKDGGILLVDEDGIQKRLPENLIASVLSGSRIRGNVLIVGQDIQQQEPVLSDVPEQYFALLAFDMI